MFKTVPETGYCHRFGLLIITRFMRLATLFFPELCWVSSGVIISPILTSIISKLLFCCNLSEIYYVLEWDI